MSNHNYFEGDYLPKMHKIGKQSSTHVAVCYLEGITPQNTVEKVQKLLQTIIITGLSDCHL